MAYAKNHEEAKDRARSNAAYFQVPYVIFQDTSGNWQVEQLTLSHFAMIYSPDWIFCHNGCHYQKWSPATP